MIIINPFTGEVMVANHSQSGAQRAARAKGGAKPATKKRKTTVSKLSRGAYKAKGTETVEAHDSDFGGLRTHITRWDDTKTVKVETRIGQGKKQKTIATANVPEDGVKAAMAAQLKANK